MDGVISTTEFLDGLAALGLVSCICMFTCPSVGMLRQGLPQLSPARVPCAALQDFTANSLNLNSAQQTQLMSWVFSVPTAQSMAISQPIQELVSVSETWCPS